MKTIAELHNEYKHLFEINEGADSCFCRHGEPLRGIEVDDGWLSIVEDMLKRINSLINEDYYIENPDTDDQKYKYIKSDIKPTIKIFQIKEKFGDYTCYYAIKNDPRGTTSSRISCIVTWAEAQANMTCERCGRVGESDGTRITKTRKRWIKTHCDKCKKMK